MFFATQLKEVSAGMALDMAGRSLIFIGTMPVKSGNWVYTDGKFIFGNAPPKGSAIIFDVSSGIPILGYLDEQEVKGYFNRQGRFKDFAIATDSWITNSDKKFFHGSEFMDENKVIDAYFNENNEQIIITDGIWQDNHTLEHTMVYLYVFNDVFDRYPDEYNMLAVTARRPYVIKQTLGSNAFPNEKTNPQIFTNDKGNSEFDLEPYAKDIEARALNVAYLFMQQEFPRGDDCASFDEITLAYQSYANSHTAPTYPDEPLANPPAVYEIPNALSTPALPRPQKPFIAHTNVHILSSNLTKDGFDGLIFASTYGYCFPYIQPRFAAEAEWDGMPNFKLMYEYKCVPFGCSAIYRIGEELNPVVFRDFGGIKSNVGFFDTNEIAIGENTHWGNSIVDGIKANDFLQMRRLELSSGIATIELTSAFFPVGEGFFQMDKFGRLAFFNSEKEKIAEDILVHDDFVHIEIEHGEFFWIWSFNDKPYINCKIYTSDGKTEEAIIDVNNPQFKNDEYLQGEVENGVIPMDGYYIKSTTGELEPLNFTPLFYQFKNGSYLYGVKGGKLFLKNKEGEQTICDDVKNFRLQELKNISKARR